MPESENTFDKLDSPQVAYAAARLDALRAVQRYDGSEASYHKSFEALIAFEAVAGKSGEEQKALAAFQKAERGRGTRLPLIDDMLDHMIARISFGNAASVFARLIKAGMVENTFAGEFVAPDASLGGVKAPESGAHPFVENTAPKTMRILRALLENKTLGVFADDIHVIRGADKAGRLRRTSYTLIEIPRIQIQIAVNDRMGEMTFVGHGLRPLDFWAKGKDAIRAAGGVHEIPYSADERWTTQILNAIASDLPPPEARTKVKIEKGRRPLLSESIIVEWLRATYEKTGEWASQCTKTPVYGYDPDGAIIEIEGEVWVNINSFCYHGYCGLPKRGEDGYLQSLGLLKKKHALRQAPLTEKVIVEWLKATYEKTGEWASQETKGPVYAYGADGTIIEVKGKVWKTINSACNLGGRQALPKRGEDGYLQGLGPIKEKHGLGQARLSEEIIVEWLKATHKKTGKWASQETKGPVYGYGPDGTIIEVKGETWRNINSCSQQGRRGLPERGEEGYLQGLGHIKKKHGLGQAVPKLSTRRGPAPA